MPTDPDMAVGATPSLSWVTLRRAHPLQRHPDSADVCCGSTWPHPALPATCTGPSPGSFLHALLRAYGLSRSGDRCDSFATAVAPLGRWTPPVGTLNCGAASSASRTREHGQANRWVLTLRNVLYVYSLKQPYHFSEFKNSAVSRHPLSRASISAVIPSLVCMPRSYGSSSFTASRLPLLAADIRAVHPSFVCFPRSHGARSFAISAFLPSTVSATGENCPG